jgi:hypothetical protein
VKTNTAPLRAAVLRLAKENVEFREALSAELRVADVGMRMVYLPKEVRDQKPMVPPGTDLEIWKYEAAGKLYAIAFAGKQGKPLFHNRFRNEAERERTIQEAIDSRKSRAESVQKRKDEKKNFQHGLKEGDILYSSWGYDQTNIDFYQVVSVIAKAVVIREISKKVVRSEQGADYVEAVPGRFIGAPLRKLPQGSAGHLYIKINSHQSAYPWDGKAKYQTAMGWGH